MKLLIDQDIARGTAGLLRAHGHDAVSASEIGMGRSPDSLLIEVALNESRIIATLDSDYHQIIATEFLSRPSVIFLREKSPTAKLAADLIHLVCRLYEEKLLAGCLLTCTQSTVRMRSLPLRKV